MRKLFIALLLFYCLFFPIVLQAQVGTFFTKYEPSRRWSVGVQLSPTELQGDADNLKLGLSFGGHVKYSFGQSFALKLNGDIGQLKGGRDHQRISRNGTKQYNGIFRRGKNVNDQGNQAPSEDSYSFTNNFWDLNLCTVYTLGNISFLKPLRKYQVFMFVGFGAIWSKAKGDWETKAERWRDVAGDTSAPLGEYLRYNGDPRSRRSGVKYARNLALPFGIGVKRNFGRILDLGIELRMHYTRSDNLDALSAPVWRNRYTDFYTLLGLQASFKIRSKKENDEHHYDWLNPVETLYEKMDSITAVVTALAKDSDNDGVADFLDKEPNTPAGVNVYGNGVTVVEAASRDTTIINNATCCDCYDVIFPPVVFDPGSATIRPEFYGILHEIAKKMKECPDLNINTIGYPDGSVGAKSGEQLSRTRVNAVVDYLNDYYGIQRNRISVDYKTTEDSGSRYQKTRKVEIKKAK